MLEKTNLSLTTKVAKIPVNVGFEPSAGTVGNVGDNYLDPSGNFYFKTAAAWIRVDASILS